MIAANYVLPRRDVKLAGGRRLHYAGKFAADATATQGGQWRHGSGLHVLASFGPIPEIGPVLHVSLSYRDRREVPDRDVAEVALAFFPEGVVAHLARGGAFGPVTHLYSDARVQSVAEGVIPLVTERIREMLGGVDDQ